MYRCQDCKAEFEYVEVVFERHGLDTPPYERIRLCPYCHSDHYEEIRNTHCRCCGSKLRVPGEYCSEDCRKAGEKLWERQRTREERRQASPLILAIKETEEYNKAHGTKLSYGQYVALKMTDKQGRKNR